MQHDDCKYETCQETIAWLKLARWGAPKYVFPSRFGVLSRTHHPSYLRFFDEQTLASCGFMVLPMAGIWSPSQDAVLSTLRDRGHERLYAIGFQHNRDVCLSASTSEAASVERLLDKYFMFCLIASRANEFLLLHTNFGYWLLAGPPSLITGLAGTSAAGISESFVKAAADENREPGRSFVADLARAYGLHNQRMLALQNNGQPTGLFGNRSAKVECASLFDKQGAGQSEQPLFVQVADERVACARPRTQHGPPTLEIVGDNKLLQMRYETTAAWREKGEYTVFRRGPGRTTIVQDFSRQAFLNATDEARDELCADLAAFLTSQVKLALRNEDSASLRVDVASACVEQLKAWGHELWSWDESCDFQLWVPNLADQVGITVDFTCDVAVDVSWRDPTQL